ncbi:MAG TPA: carboxypeptidase-like regulatory domain-containing protein, partial [Gemmatimonadales bacterium]
MRFTIGRACFSAVLALGALALVSPGRLAAQGEVTGRVTDKTSGAGLAGAQVSVVGTTIRGLSGQDGRFRLANVPAGAATVRVAFIGYSTVTQPVTVTAGGSVESNFALSQAAIGLEAVVVTAT